MKSFELQTYIRGKWKIDSVFDDAQLALFEARRVEESRRYTGIRVIEEIYDEASHTTTSRTIFRAGSADQPAKPRAPQMAPAPPRPHGAGQERAYRTRAPAAPRKLRILVPALYVLGVTGVGVLALLGLRSLMAM